MGPADHLANTNCKIVNISYLQSLSSSGPSQLHGSDNYGIALAEVQVDLAVLRTQSPLGRCKAFAFPELAKIGHTRVVGPRPNHSGLPFPAAVHRGRGGALPSFRFPEWGLKT